MDAVGIFSRKTTAPAEARSRVAATALPAPLSGSVSGLVGAGRGRAWQLASVGRARDLFVSVAQALPLEHYRTMWNGDEVELVPEPPEGWMERPDPNRTRSWMFGWTVDSLFWWGRAHWYVTSRYATGFPSSFILLPTDQVFVDTVSYVGNAPFGEYKLSLGGNPLPKNDVVSFWHSSPGVLESGAQVFSTAARLEAAANRFAATPFALGYLQQRAGTEPMTGDELRDLCDAWYDARLGSTGAIAALNAEVEWVAEKITLDDLQLLETRQHSALEIARVCNITPVLLGAPTGGGSTVQYSNALEARRQLALDSSPYLATIEERLSADDIIARGRIVRFDRDALLHETVSMLEPGMSEGQPQELPQ
jgi:hypothetical protein